VPLEVAESGAETARMPRDSPSKANAT